MTDNNQLNFFTKNSNQISLQSNCRNLTGASMPEIFLYYDQLNHDNSHKTSSDDICTPMECVKRMIDYIPEEFWHRKTIRVFDPCCGNGNFGAYCQYKTSLNNL